MTAVKRFTTSVTKDAKGRGIVPVPFDPNAVWGGKAKHHVTGMLNGCKVRGTVESDGGGWSMRIGASWMRDFGVPTGEKLKVELAPEGPQRDGLAPDLVAALDAEPEAAAFFDSLAQFYRKAYLRWIDATKRKPDERARRIAETIGLLKAGEKERP